MTQGGNAGSHSTHLGFANLFATDVFVTEALKDADLEDLAGAVINVLTASRWKVEMLYDPENKPDLVSVLKEPFYLNLMILRSSLSESASKIFLFLQSIDQDFKHFGISGNPYSLSYSLYILY
jgi:hypothetical protein